MMVGVDSLRGQLLVAGPALTDPNFLRTVVLVGEHNDEGALGVVLNRPAPVRVEEAAPPLSAISGGDPLFLGGPVQPRAAVVLAEFAFPDAAGLLVFDSIGFLVGDVPAAAVDTVRRARVFAGYAGWGPGQIERELEASSWIVEPARADDVFTERPEALWGAVLRRKGGRFTLLSTMPVDPSLN